MTQYVSYDSNGEIRSWGSSDNPQPYTTGAGILLSAGDPTTSWVSNGTLTAYTAEQAATKALIPSYLATWSNSSFSWVDQRQMQQVKLDTWTAIKGIRDGLINGGFSWTASDNSVNVFDSDPVSQGRITGAVVLAQLASQSNQSFSKDWILQNNTVITLTASDMVSVGITLGTFVQNLINKGETLRVQINSATSMSQLESTSWQ